MEKLKAALETARSKREGAAPPPTPRRAAERETAKPKPPKAAQAWEALTPFVPKRQVLAKHLVVAGQASDAATPFDVLRTKTLLQMRQNGWTRLAITSPMPRSGKSTTACNLALGLGRQKSLKAMLFDMDLGSPSVHSFFNHKPKSTIAEALTGQIPFEDHALRIGSNIAVSMAGDPIDDPTRILLASETEDYLDEVQARYQPDIMIFDLPSVLVGDNTRAFLKNVDCALIIARANTTKYHQFDTCEREVAEHTDVLGVILNATRSRDTGALVG